MPKISPITKSPIAAYLTANKAKSVRDGNTCRFFNPKGAYLGFQEKQEIEGVKFFSTFIFGENFQPMFSKNVVIASEKWLFHDNNFKLGISPVCVSLAKKVFFIDFIRNKYEMISTEKLLQNTVNLIAKDARTGIGLHSVERPYRYSENLVSKTLDADIPKDNRKSKFTIN